MLSQDEVDIVVGVLKVVREGGREEWKGGRERGKGGTSFSYSFIVGLLVVEHKHTCLIPSLPPSLPPSHINQIASKTVQDCMVPMDKVFCLSTQDELDGPMLVCTREGGREGGKEGRLREPPDTYLYTHLPSLPPSHTRP